MTEESAHSSISLAHFAQSIIETQHLADKLTPPPPHMVVSEGQSSLRIDRPFRSERIKIERGKAIKVPPIMGVADKDQRLRIIHALANHELQAVELFAWAILAFGDTPPAFRRGLLAILAEEQIHCELYCDLLSAGGIKFGDYPLSGHFWNNVDAMQTPLDFLCVMGLTYENANLDFANEYRESAKSLGLTKFAETLTTVHEDEIRHVAFAWRWFKRFKSDTDSSLLTYKNAVKPPLGLHRARGKTFDRASRARAGLDETFIAACEDETAKRPNGRPR